MTILRDIFHRSRTIERDQRDNVLNTCGPKLAQRIAHARTLHLKHANRIRAAIEIIRRLIVQRDGRKINLRPASLENIDRTLQDGQSFQAEEVELHQPGGLDPFHVELRYRHIGTRIAIKRHKFMQRSVANHHTGGVGRRVSQQAFNRLTNIKQSFDGLIRLFLFLQTWLLLSGAADWNRFDAFDRDHFRKTIYLPIRHLQHAPNVANGGF